MKESQHADVVFALTGDVRQNSRALRQLRALSERHLDIEVLSVGDREPVELPIPGTRLRQIPSPHTGGPGYFWRIHRAFKRKAGAVSSRVYHASDLYALPALEEAARQHGGRVLYDARELYPHVVATIHRPWARAFWKVLESRYVRRTDAVLTVSDEIADLIAAAYDVERPTVMYNVPDRSDLDARPRTRPRNGISSEHHVILHQGQMRPYRGCEMLVDAMKDVANAILVFLGGGPIRDALERQAETARIAARVRFVGQVVPEDLLAYTSTADVGVSLLEDVCLNHHYALPNKVFEYLTAGVPVIASDLPEIRKVVRGFDVGLLIQPGNRNDLVAALNQAILDPGLRARWRRNIPRALETYSWEEAARRFRRVYDRLLE